MLILFLPIIVIGLAYSFEYEKFLQSLSALGITAALTYFLSNLGRDQGKKKENILWKIWGGPPTSQLFSYEDSRIDTITKERYHSRMKNLSKIEDDINFKSAALDEVGDIYRSWTKILISKTRDTKEYPLIFKENINYGFRRNLWGLRSAGIIITILCFVGNYAFHAVFHGWDDIGSFSEPFYISESALTLILFIWGFIINDEWVRIPAFAYAERLLEAIDRLNIEGE